MAFSPLVLPFSFPNLPQVQSFFTTIAAGNMSLATSASETERLAISKKKRCFMDAYNIQEWVEVYQVHGDTMYEAPESFNIYTLPDISADGLYTDRKGYALTIKTADCQPILFAHVKGLFVAAIHVGWRGNAMNFPSSAVAHLCKTYQVLPSELMAVRGPSLGPGAAEFINFDKEWDQAFQPWYCSQTKKMDLWSLTKYQLEQAGISSRNIFSFDMCTQSLPEYFFSHRNKHTGRQIAAIWITSER